MLRDAPRDWITSLDVCVLVHKNKHVVLLTIKTKSVRSGGRIWRSPPKMLIVGIVPQDQTLEDTLFGIFSVVWVCGV